MRHIVSHGRIARQFLMFACVGAAGFIVDSAVLTMTLRATDAGLYVSRLVSFLCAATFTWAANRLFTFRSASREPSRRVATQWLQFVAVNAIGGAINLGLYAYLVSHVESVARQPVIGVAAGSVAGLIFNFALSRSLVFRAHSARATAVEPTRRT